MGVALLGLLTQQITLLASTKVANGAGGFTETWAETATCRGRISAGGMGSRSRMESLVGSQAIGAELHEIVLNTETVNPAWRCQDSDGVQYEILRVQRQDGFSILAGRRV